MMKQDSTTVDMERTLRLAEMLQQWVIKAAVFDGHIHAPTVIAAAAQMTGTMVFRSLGAIAPHIKPGTVMLSAQAHAFGPKFMDLIFATAQALVGPIDHEAVSAAKVTTTWSRLSLLELQAHIDPFYEVLAKTEQLSALDGARLFAVATGQLIGQFRADINPADGCALALRGLVEGAKTVPRRLSGTS